MFGLVMNAEVASAEKVLHGSEKPFTAIIGGAKVSDKILIIENLLDRATDIIIGGGMAKAGKELLLLIQKYINARTWKVLPTTFKI
jgi:3-phosphoglycerate kinase